MNISWSSDKIKAESVDGLLCLGLRDVKLWTELELQQLQDRVDALLWVKNTGANPAEIDEAIDILKTATIGVQR